MIIEVIDIGHWAKIDQSCCSRLPNAWERIRQWIFERDNHCCVYCGATEGQFEVDHVFPRSRGGADTESNLVCSCRPCNQSKRNKTPKEWGWRPNYGRG
jgi:5-methylcytosine-specific restriction endonuclease McrA